MRWTHKNESAPKVERQPHYRDCLRALPVTTILANEDFTRGGIHGCNPDDWLQAERELQEKYNKSSGE